MKKDQVILTCLFLALSGCGGSKFYQRPDSESLPDNNVFSELDIVDNDDVRSFFEEESDIFSEGEQFVGWAEAQEMVDLDDFYDLTSTVSSTRQTVAVGEAIQDTSEGAEAFEERLVGVETAVDVDYETTTVIVEGRMNEEGSTELHIDVPLDPETELVDRDGETADE